VKWNIQFLELSLACQLYPYVGIVAKRSGRTHLEVAEVTEHKVDTLGAAIVPFVVVWREYKQRDEWDAELLGTDRCVVQGSIVLDCGSMSLMYKSEKSWTYFACPPYASSKPLILPFLLWAPCP
jgi:hypothetical protein